MRLSPVALALIASLGLAGAACAQGTGNPTTSEVLVLTSATELTHTTSGGKRVAMEIQNNGPNDIYCGFTAATTISTKARRIAAKPTSGPSDSWAVDAGPYVRIWCIAASASQLTGAATVVSELLVP